MNRSKNELSSVCLKFSPKKWEGKIPHEILIEALEEIHPRAKIKKYTKNEVLEKFIGIFVVEDKNKISFKKKKTFGATYLGYLKKKQKTKKQQLGRLKVNISIWPAAWYFSKYSICNFAPTIFTLWL